MQRTACLAALLALALLAGCSALSADPVFTVAQVEPVECANGQLGCVRVFSGVDGSGVGRGACILYATTSSGQVAVAASGELDLIPGRLFEWIVRVPGHLGSLGWNPVCVPTAER